MHLWHVEGLLENWVNHPGRVSVHLPVGTWLYPKQKGHVLRVVFSCSCCQCKLSWSSSSVRRPLCSKPKVCGFFLCDVYTFPQIGWFTASLVLACFRLSITSLLSLLSWESLACTIYRVVYISVFSQLCIFINSITQYIGHVDTLKRYRKQQESPCRMPWTRCTLSQSIS